MENTMSNSKVYNDEILERIMTIMGEKNISQSELTNYLGLERSTFSTWKNNHRRSYLRYADQIAAYLGVSYGYLLTGSEDQFSSELTKEEKALIAKIRTLPPEQRLLIYKMLNAV